MIMIVLALHKLADFNIADFVGAMSAASCDRILARCPARAGPGRKLECESQCPDVLDTSRFVLN
ncbi:hypothetical protein JQ594_10235 [Bradyrhizobium manausense]|uniref:hypothetical protein n=1 Tax=Bradyrhizobium manausense TaxID=989370 RepID=UPI001BA8A05A|nr:hypothetical protein [Bradyrhizobium manausense]MBR0686292.1 hypothetical protein [Bradyrhizobium manausense]